MGTRLFQAASTVISFFCYFKDRNFSKPLISAPHKLLSRLFSHPGFGLGFGTGMITVIFFP